MIKQEWKSFLKSKIMIIALIGISIVPAIYTVLFLGSMWTPYQNVDKLPVAVVNNDVSVEYNGKQLTVGDDMVKNLKEDASLDFRFVDDQEAQKGLKEGSYYMVISIPEDFSKNASTVMDSEPQKMELKYEVDPGTNFVATKMSETAMKEIKSQVSSAVTKAYTEVMSDQITDAADGIKKASNGSAELLDGVEKLSSGNSEITENLNLLADSTLTFKEGNDTLVKGLEEYVNGVLTVNDGVNTLNDGAITLSNGTNELNNGFAQGLTGAKTLKDKTTELSSGAKQVNDGAKTLSEGANTLNNGTSQYTQGVTQLTDGTNQYINGATQLAAGAEQLSGLSQLDKVSSGISQLNQAVTYGTDQQTSLLAGSKEMSDELTKVQTVADKINNSDFVLKFRKIWNIIINGEKSIGDAQVALSECKENAENVSESIDSIQEKVQQDVDKQLEEQISQVTNDANTQSENVNTEISTANENLEQAEEMVSALEGVDEQQKADILALISSSKIDSQAPIVQSEDVKVSISDENFEEVKSINKDVDKVILNLSGAQGELADAAQTIKDLLTNEDGYIDDPFNAVTKAIDELADGARQIYGGVSQTSDALIQLESATASFPKAAQGITELNAGFDQLISNNDLLLSGTASLNEATPTIILGNQQICDGANALLLGTTQLADGALQFEDGTDQLYTGVIKLSDGAAALNSGATQIKDGSSQLADGTGKLASNSDTLLSGAQKLDDGAVQLNDGSVKLAEGSKTLGEGLSDAKTGTKTLSDGLKDGAKQTEGINLEEENLDMFSAPLDTKEVKITQVENNGHAMAPYMMSVALWVGAIVLCELFKLNKYDGKKIKSGASWWIGKASVIVPIAILYALVMVGSLCLFNGFEPVEWLQLTLFACLTSIAFVTIVAFFNYVLGLAGTYLMLIFMVIQLAGSAGTYPIEVSAPFVSTIHNFLPFSYSVFAFRSTIAAGESIMGSVWFMLGIIAVFTTLTIIAYVIKAKHINNGRRTMVQFLAEKGIGE